MTGSRCEASERDAFTESESERRIEQDKQCADIDNDRATLQSYDSAGSSSGCGGHYLGSYYGLVRFALRDAHRRCEPARVSITRAWRSFL